MEMTGRSVNIGPSAGSRVSVLQELYTLSTIRSCLKKGKIAQEGEENNKVVLVEIGQGWQKKHQCFVVFVVFIVVVVIVDVFVAFVAVVFVVFVAVFSMLLLWLLHSFLSVPVEL